MNYPTFLTILITGLGLSLLLDTITRFKLFIVPTGIVVAPFFAMTTFFAFCYVDLILQWRIFDKVSSFLPM